MTPTNPGLLTGVCKLSRAALTLCWAPLSLHALLDECEKHARKTSWIANSAKEVVESVRDVLPHRSVHRRHSRAGAMRKQIPAAETAPGVASLLFSEPVRRAAERVEQHSGADWENARCPWVCESNWNSESISSHICFLHRAGRCLHHDPFPWAASALSLRWTRSFNVFNAAGVKTPGRLVQYRKVWLLIRAWAEFISKSKATTRGCTDVKIWVNIIDVQY